MTGIEKSRELTFMSLGWLSREGHVLVEKNGSDYKISLRKKRKVMKKGVVLVVVIGIVMVICTLAVAAIFLMTQESRLAEHKIRRSRVFFAAQSGMVRALERLRKGVVNPSETIHIGVGVPGYPTAGIPVIINYVNDNSGPGGTNPVNITVNY